MRKQCTLVTIINKNICYEVNLQSLNNDTIQKAIWKMSSREDQFKSDWNHFLEESIKRAVENETLNTFQVKLLMSSKKSRTKNHAPLLTNWQTHKRTDPTNYKKESCLETSIKIWLLCHWSTISLKEKFERKLSARLFNYSTLCLPTYLSHYFMSATLRPYDIVNRSAKMYSA
jgi:hypothetical protein